MPLVCGDVSRNIREMRRSGHPQNQSVAASLEHERQCARKAKRRRRRAKRRVKRAAKRGM